MHGNAASRILYVLLVNSAVLAYSARVAHVADGMAAKLSLLWLNRYWMVHDLGKLTCPEELDEKISLGRLSLNPRPPSTIRKLSAEPDAKPRWLDQGRRAASPRKAGWSFPGANDRFRGTGHVPMVAVATRAEVFPQR